MEVNRKLKHRIDIRGAMIPNDYKWYYDWFGEDSTCPISMPEPDEEEEDEDDENPNQETGL